ncbi:hypothetical protein HDU67_006306 [Dinochytrium kinnereticum]|nr:hypothetical protein HDU67_006306 [Dinochytrium kinnereticum]
MTCSRSAVSHVSKVIRSCPVGYVYDWDGIQMPALKTVMDGNVYYDKRGRCVKDVDGEHCLGKVMGGIYLAVLKEGKLYNERFQVAVCTESMRRWLAEKANLAIWNDIPITVDD